MERQEKDILFVAYRGMILKNLDTGLLRQHLSDSDFYAFCEYPNFFLEILDAAKEKHSTNGMIEKFYELNPKMVNNKLFAKEVFKRLVAYDDFTVMREKFGEEFFTQDIGLITEVAKRLGGHMITGLGFTGLKTNKELMESLYNMSNFSLTWFKLPPPEDDTLIKQILQKDEWSYTALNETQRLNKEYALIAMGSKVVKYSNARVYDSIPDSIKVDQEIALLASEKGITEQPGKAFLHDGVLLSLLEAIKKERKLSTSKIILDKIEGINIGAFEKPKNIEVLFGWINENNQIINFSHDNYSSIHKMLKSISKINPYVKERFNSNTKLWNIGNIGETRYQDTNFFRNYFMNNIPQMYQETVHYVRAVELSESLSKSNEKQKKMKI